MRNRKIFYGITLTLIVTLVGILLFIYKGNNLFEQRNSIFVINEVCSNNFSGLLDYSSNGYADWVEIYNTTDEEQNLSGYTLSKGKDYQKNFLFGDLTLGAHSYILVYCNGIGNDIVSAPFKISSDEDYLLLSSPEGVIVDDVNVPSLGLNECYGRIEDGGDEWGILTATPYQTNMAAQVVSHATLTAPSLSLTSGFYEEPITLTINVPSGTTVFYSTDASEPTLESVMYTEPITLHNASAQPNVYNNYTNVCQDYSYVPPEDLVDKANVIRAIALNPNGEYSEITTGVYFVGIDAEAYDTCVLSLVTDPVNLFDDDQGIYVTGTEYDTWYQSGQSGDAPARNYEESGTPSERQAVMNFFDTDGTLQLEQAVGIRIQGNSSRNLKKKRFSIFSREEYSGSDYFDFDITDSERKVHSFSLFVDVNNAFASAAMFDRDIAPQSAKKCLVFLDGEYWETYYLVEKVSGDYIEQKYNVGKDNVILIKNDTVANGNSEDKILYENLNEYLLNADFTSDESYEELCQIIDIQSFLDHFTSCLYLANMNWRLVNNHILWRSREITDALYEDGKWRWVMNDFDMYYNFGYEIDSFQTEMHFGGTYMNSGYLPNLLKNETFKKQFVLTFMDLANVNYEGERAVSVLRSLTDGEDSLENFLMNRMSYAAEDMKESLKLQGNLAQVILQENIAGAGCIRINSVTINLEDGSWMGQYFTDYPVTVTAVAGAGYRFVGWRINGSEELVTDTTIDVPVDASGTQIEAIYE